MYVSRYQILIVRALCGVRVCTGAYVQTLVKEYFERFPSQRREQSADERQLEDEEYAQMKRRDRAGKASTSRRNAGARDDDAEMMPVAAPMMMTKRLQKRARGDDELRTVVTGHEHELEMAMDSEMEMDAGGAAAVQLHLYGADGSRKVRLVADEVNDADGVRRHEGDKTRTATRATRTQERAKKPYEPKFRTGAFALLVSLDRAHREGYDYLCTEALKRRAELSNLSASSFFSTENTTRQGSSNFVAGGGMSDAMRANMYSAWSGMAALVNKHCYVHAWSNPKKFRLTPEGQGTTRTLSR